MSEPTKLRAPGGNAVSELTKLKAKWRGMADDARSFWQELFVSQTSQADIRKQMVTKLQINLRFDKQLNQFRKWVEAQEARDHEAELMLSDEQRVRDEFGDAWSLDQIREEVLKRSYARALATGDFAAGRKTIVQDLNVKKVMLDRAKFEFDAAKQCRKIFPTLKAIHADKSLSEAEKTQLFMEKIFGKAEPSPNAPTVRAQGGKE